MMYKKERKTKLFADYVTQVYGAHDLLILSLLQHLQGLARSTTEGSGENIGHNVQV